MRISVNWNFPQGLGISHEGLGFPKIIPEAPLTSHISLGNPMKMSQMCWENICIDPGDISYICPRIVTLSQYIIGNPMENVPDVLGKIFALAQGTFPIFVPESSLCPSI
jgi:hypothetical protein